MPLTAVLGGIAGACGRDERERAARLIRTLYGEARVRLYDSGTSALREAVRIAAVRAGGAPIALPAFGCFDLATAVVGARVRVLPYDLDPDTLAPDLASLESALGRGAGTVVVAPLYGVPVDWDAISALAARTGATLIEDAAQADGADWHGRPMGTFGDMTVLSFGRGKGWSGVRGGSLLVRSPRLLDRTFGEPRPASLTGDLAVAARGIAQWMLARPASFRLLTMLPGLDVGRTVYRQPRHPERMSRAAAAILCRTRAAAEKEQWIRQYNARRILDAIGALPGIRIVRPPTGSTPGYLRLPLLVDSGAAAVAGNDEARRIGVAFSYPAPLTALGPIREINADPTGRWPGAELLAARLITLPVHRFTRASDIAAIARLLGGSPDSGSAEAGTADPRSTPRRGRGGALRARSA